MNWWTAAEALAWAKDEAEVKTLTVALGYMFLGLANFTFQGLLTLHTLLDKPFGSHPSQFPLSTETNDLSRCIKYLTHPKLRSPEVLRLQLEKVESLEKANAEKRRRRQADERDSAANTLIARSSSVAAAQKLHRTSSCDSVSSHAE